MGTPNQLSRMARTTAGYLAKTIILLVVLNVLLGGFYWIYGAYEARNSNAIYTKYPKLAQMIAKQYPSMSQDDVSELLRETWSRPLVSKSIVGFGEGPYHGKFVNVTDAGFRPGTNQGPWPPVRDGKSVVVFLFGGSTTFGYGVTDAQALGSQLQPLLTQKLGRPVVVYNFGQSKYGSTQERLLFEKLLLEGQKPDIAIFVDGLNDFQFTWGDEELNWTSYVGGGTSPAAGVPTWGSWLRDGIEMLPMARLAKGVRSKMDHKHSFSDVNPNHHYDDEEALRKVIDRYYLNVQMIEADSKALGIQTLFVWQPVPTYAFDLKYHPFTQNGFGDFAYTKRGYPLMADAVAKKRPDDFLWCADMQKDLHEPLYVDAVHYSPKMTGMVAGCIADGVK
jgi:hypothetical protein